MEGVVQNPTEEFVILAWGLVHASVCTNLPTKEAARRLNAELPTGISSRWSLSADKKFATGEKHPHKCPQVTGNRHLLFSC